MHFYFSCRPIYLFFIHLFLFILFIYFIYLFIYFSSVHLYIYLYINLLIDCILINIFTHLLIINW